MRNITAICLFTQLMLIWLVSIARAQSTYYVDNSNDPTVADSNRSGGPDQAFRSVAHGISQLQPGDTLIIRKGNDTYYENDITLSEFDGNELAQTVIKGEDPDNRPHIVANFLFRKASWLTIRDLRVSGPRTQVGPTTAKAGLKFELCHHIDIFNNEVFNFGGGGILFNFSDWLRVRRNVVYHNATDNPDFHSGISVFQPFDWGQDRRNQGWGIIIAQNISYENWNNPAAIGQRTGSPVTVTDGNGIICDDFLYQLEGFPNGDTNQTLQDNRGKTNSDRTLLVNPSGYPKFTLVESNLCFSNGGSGVQVFLSQGVMVKNNTLVNNRWNTNADEQGDLSINTSRNCRIFNNLCHSLSGNVYAATQRGTGWNNHWNFNLLFNQWSRNFDYYEGPGHFGVIDSPNHGGRNIFQYPGYDLNATGYRVSTASPAFQAGHDVTTGFWPHAQWSGHYDEDLQGVNRTLADGTVDIGASEVVD